VWPSGNVAKRFGLSFRSGHTAPETKAMILGGQAYGFLSVMMDYQASLEKLRSDAAEAALIRDRATDTNKRSFFDRLYQHFSRLADEVEQAMIDGLGSAE
jgi:hypothetical protein